MPVPTTELGLLKGVDADDTADYLVTSLANSLTTVDSLFNNVSGHTHGGAHQGGPISASGIANASISNAQLGPDVARTSLLVNGGFEIWQRGNGPFTAPGATYAADRWQLYAPIGTLSVSRDAANADTNGYCAAVTVTGGVSAGNAQNLYQYPWVTADGISVLPGMTVSFSIRVKTSVANGCRLNLTATGGTTSYSAYHTGNSAWQTLTIAGYPIPAGTGGVVLTVAVNFEAAGTYYIDRAMLVVGSQPANYVPMHPADDLARCLRYYEVIGDTANGVPFIGAYTTGGATNYTNVFFAAKKALAPTCTKNGTWTAVNAGQPSLSAASVHGVLGAVVVTSTGLGYSVPGAAGQNITIEANP